MAYNSPFDLYHWFVNVFAGNETIFLAISFLFLASMAGMFRFPLIITGFFFALFILMLQVIAGVSTKIIVVYIIAIIAGLIFVRWVK